LLTTLVSAESKEINILFIGNSFTYRHDLPGLVKTVFEEGHPDLKVNVAKIVYGGQDLFRHYEFYFSQSTVRRNTITIPEIEDYKRQIQSFLDMKAPPEFFQAYFKKIGKKPGVSDTWEAVGSRLEAAMKTQGWLEDAIKQNKRVKWDYLVLQSWQDVVAAPDAGYAEYAKKFAELARQEGAQVILYITAPYAQNSAPVKGPLDSAETKMQMQAIHHLAGEIKPYAVVPVALGIEAIQKGGTDLTFRYHKDFHPNNTCAFLTANMFYAAFFKESTGGFKFNTATETKLTADGKDPDGGNAKTVFDNPTKTLLQNAAYNAVMEFQADMKKGKPVAAGGGQQ
jgi:hypothetical protein